MKTHNEKAIKMLKTAKGQVDGLIKMIEDDRYCMDISNQVLATTALLRNVNVLILEDHLNHCVKQALREEATQEKIDEISALIKKISR